MTNKSESGEEKSMAGCSARPVSGATAVNNLIVARS
jgi:hypothetical protein